MFQIDFLVWWNSVFHFLNKKITDEPEKLVQCVCMQITELWNHLAFPDVVGSTYYWKHITGKCINSVAIVTMPGYQDFNWPWSWCYIWRTRDEGITYPMETYLMGTWKNGVIVNSQKALNEADMKHLILLWILILWQQHVSVYELFNRQSWASDVEWLHVYRWWLHWKMTFCLD